MDKPLKVKHSGAIGDIIYSLPYVQSLGKKIDFYIGEHTYVRGIPDNFTSSYHYNIINTLFPLSKDLTDPSFSNFKTLARLLKVQPYINNVFPLDKNEHYDLDLDEFRKSWTDSQSIIETVNQYFNFKGFKKDEPFLFNIPINESFKDICCCSRSSRAIGFEGEKRYRNMIEWIIKNKNPRKFVFLGIEKEYEYFVKNIWSEIEYLKTGDFYESAIVINSCPFGIFNSSAPLAISAALNKERYIENPMSYILNVIFINSKNERYF